MNILKILIAIKKYFLDITINNIVIKNHESVCLNNKNIVEFICNDNLKYLFCHNNQLTYLILNDKLEVLCCSSNNLTYLVLNDKIKYVECHNNQLKKLILNDKLERLYCDINTKLLNYNKNTEIIIYE